MPCENVIVNEDKTEATCTTTAEPAECEHGDAPDGNSTTDGTMNCFDPNTGPWNTLIGYTGMGEVSYTGRGKECATTCESSTYLLFNKRVRVN